MTTSLTVKPIGALDFSVGFTPEQMQLLKDTICKDATDDELRLFSYQCVRRKLDPFAKQLYAIKRWDKEKGRYVMGIQTGIDGFRVVAERTGRYRGQIGPEWCGPDGVWKDVWLDQKYPSAARVGVLREGCSGPIWGVALWREYVQTKADGSPIRMWQDMPANQLAKCAESLALRKAFPEDLSGIYTDEEMGQADNQAGKEKAEDTQKGIQAHKEGEKPATLVIQPKVDPGPEQGDPLRDWIVPPFVKPIAGRRLGTIPIEELRSAVKWAQAYFDREKKTPQGGWATFFDKAVEMFDVSRQAKEEGEVLDVEFEEIPEPGSNG